MLQLLILAGGLATRLDKLTKDKPKSLVEINKKPFIHHQLSLVKTKGIDNVVLCVGHMGDMIKEYVGDGSRWGLTINYSNDGQFQLGTAGAIRNALGILNENFFVLYGDSYLDINYKEIESAYFKNECNPLMVVLENNNHWDVSNVELKKNNLISYNKSARSKNMKYIDFGLSVLNKKIFLDTINRDYFDLSQIYQKLSFSNNLFGYEVFNRFYEIGTLKGLKETEKYLNWKEG